MRIVSALAWLLCSTLILPGCGDDDPEPSAPCSLADGTGCPDGQVCKEGDEGAPICVVPCSVLEQTGCDPGLACEEVSDGTTDCFAPVHVKGRVFDAMTEFAVEGARVVARDANDAVVSKVAISGVDGDYDLVVPATRDPEGNVVDTSYTLRADANGYLPFPKAPRVALPVEIEPAGDPPVVQSTATDIALVPLPDTSGLGSISGTVLAEHAGGTLVVAGGATGVADADGSYEVFNVPAGSVSVHGYIAGVNLESATADVTAGQTTIDVDLDVASEATARVTGSISMVNASGGDDTTSIVLAVEETFEPNVARGEVPKGLRATGVSGSFAIEGVPNGNYVVLAAFENDGLVRDPDTSIGGTELVTITVAGANVDVAQGFKVTGALDVFSPGADGAEAVTGTPTFSWEDDSSEDSYDVRVFDVFGNEVWSTSGNFDPGGSKPASVEYGGPALEPGMFYQFRATSIKDGVPISSTEDLRGVFWVQ